MLLAARLRQGRQLPQQQWVPQYPLHWLDQIRLQGRRVLLGGVLGFKELLKGPVSLSCREEDQGIRRHTAGDVTQTGSVIPSIFFKLSYSLVDGIKVVQ